jgi:hypothetical protein
MQLPHLVSFDGSQVTIQFDDDNDAGVLLSASSYRASWLHSNVPCFATLPSGQRRGVIDGDTAPRIVNASILLLDVVHVDTPIETAENKTMMRVPGPTMEDCCHPLAMYGDYPPWVAGTIIESSASVEDAMSSKNVWPYLVIQWKIMKTRWQKLRWP